MNQLTSKTCVACRIGAPLATQHEIDEFVPLIPDWKIINENEVNQLKKQFS